MYFNDSRSSHLVPDSGPVHLLADHFSDCRTRCKEFWQSRLFPRYLPLRGYDYFAHHVSQFEKYFVEYIL